MRLRPTMTGNAAVVSAVVLAVAGWFFGQQFFVVGAIVIAVLWLSSLVMLIGTRTQLQLSETVEPRLVAPGADVTVVTTAANLGSRTLQLVTLSEGSSSRGGIRSSEQLTFLPRLSAGESVTWKRLFSTSQRGSFSEKTAGVTVDDPWGWLKKYGTINAGTELLVHPVIWDLRSHFFSDATAPLMQRLIQERQLDPDFDFSHLRDYQVGDDIRQIHWKTSARRGQPVVLMSEQSTTEPLGIVLNLHSEHLGHDNYERALSATASVASLLLASQYEVQLTLLFPTETVTLELTDDADLHGLLIALARQPQFSDIDPAVITTRHVDSLMAMVDPQPLSPQFYIGVHAAERETESSLWCSIVTHSVADSSPSRDGRTLTWSNTERFDTLWSQFWGGAVTNQRGGQHAS